MLQNMRSKLSKTKGSKKKFKQNQTSNFVFNANYVRIKVLVSVSKKEGVSNFCFFLYQICIKVLLDKQLNTKMEEA